MKLRFFVFCLLIHSSVFSQIDIPVDLLTGKPRVSLPLVSVGTGDVSASIVVGYHGEGYRVGETEGNAGMGWSLMASGSVGREVRGLPDDMDLPTDSRKGWLYGSQASNVYNFNPSSDNNCTDWTTLNNLISLDTEPDIFYVNAPGLNCSFVFDQNKSIQLIQQQNTKIVYTRDANQRINSFTVTNDQGVKYTFATNSLVTRQAVKFKQAIVTHFLAGFNLYSTPVSFFQTWELIQMTGIHNESISYAYTSAPGESESKTYIRKVKAAFDGIDTLYSITEKSVGGVLTTITTPYKTVTFTWGNQLISKIKVNDLGLNTTIQEIQFKYADVRNTSESKFYGALEAEREIRHFLSEIKEVKNCESRPSFLFQYYGISAETTFLPFKNKYPQDHWGYYNGATITNKFTALIPKVYENATATLGERFRIEPKAGWTLVSNNDKRNVNSTTVFYGALQSIRYPTGGEAVVTYEASNYYDEFTSTDVLGGGFRVASVNISSEQVRNYEYKQSSGVSSGKLVTRPSFAFLDGVGVVFTPNNLSGESQVLYERVSIIQPTRGKTVYTHQLPATYNKTTDIAGDWLATKTKIARYQQTVSPYACEPIGNLISDYYSNPFPPNTNYDDERGLVSQIEVLNQTGQLVTKSNYTYTRLGLRTRIKGIHYEQLKDNKIFAYGKYDIITNSRNVMLRETQSEYDSADQAKMILTKTSYTYNAKGYPKEVTVTNSDGTKYTTGTQYVGDYTVITPLSSDMQAWMIKKMTRQNLLGRPIEQYSKVNSTILKSQLFVYDSIGMTFPYLKQNFSYSGKKALVLSYVTGTPQAFKYDSLYNYSTGKGKYRLASTVEEYNPSTGLPITSIDYKKNISSILYGFGEITSIILSNARVKETVFADFEHAASSHVGVPSNFVTSEVWSGKNSYQWISTETLSKNGITKASGGFYRFSCWLKATTGSNITVTAKVYNGTAWVSFPMTYPVASSGQWKLLETRINMTGIPASFNFQLTTSANAFLDDVSFYPQQADFVRSTNQSGVGKTSTSNNLNQYSFTEYDLLGRVSLTRNTDKHILQAYEYRYSEADAPKPVSSYTCTSGCDLKAGSAVTFTADLNCLPSLTYSWTVDGSVIGTNSSNLTYTFPTNRKYNVELTVSHPTYGSTKTSLTWKIEPVQMVINLNVDNPGSILQCTDSGVRNFVAVAISGCTTNRVFNWYYKLSSSPYWIQILSAPAIPHQNTYSFSFALLNLVPQAFSVKCIVTSECSTGTGNEYDVSIAESPMLSIGFTAQSPCQ